MYECRVMIHFTFHQYSTMGMALVTKCLVNAFQSKCSFHSSSCGEEAGKVEGAQA